MSKTKMIELSRNMIGKKVKNSSGLVGTIIAFDGFDKFLPYCIEWKKFKTPWRTWESVIDLVLVEEDNNTNYTDEEIWEFLKKKMDKIGLKPIFTEDLLFDNEPVRYSESDVKRAIATAYRSGYLRSQKGRPFKIGDKKGN